MQIVAKEKLIEWLFATRALRVAAADQPFWYTSGTFGPYYINTHFLFGGEQKAKDLLKLIDSTDDLTDLTAQLQQKVMQQYASDQRYRQLMDGVAAYLADERCDFISGGARRDFFFSFCAATLLDKPHVSLFKDGTLIWSDAGGQNGQQMQAQALAGQTALHVADLVTEASSYIRAWLPGLHRLGASIHRTLAIVDRNQNGRAILAAEGVGLSSLITIDASLFKQAADTSLISSDQLQQILAFTHDPDRYMTTFLAGHPGYLEAQIALGGSSRERALRCLELGYGQRR